MLYIFTNHTLLPNLHIWIHNPDIYGHIQPILAVKQFHFRVNEWISATADFATRI